jgi:hypothetical protein
MSDTIAGLPEIGKIIHVVQGFSISQIASATARLGVADLLADTSRTAEELSSSVDADPAFFRRLLRAAAAVGMLSRTEDGRYMLTQLGQLYRKGPGWRATAYDAVNNHPAVRQAYGALERAVRAGKVAFELVHRTSFFDYLDQDPVLAEAFHGWMAGNTELDRKLIIENATFDFGRFKDIVDVGGGNGALIASILTANPGMHGTLVDRANALVSAPLVLEQAGVADRCTAVPCDFLRSVPPGGDAYILKSVLCDWSDEDCIKILRNCRSAMAQDGRVIVLGSVEPDDGTIADPEQELALSIQDITFMIMFPGKIRTVAEHAALFAAAGLRLDEVTLLYNPYNFHALEALPAVP